MIGSLHTIIKDWVHDRLSHTIIKDWVYVFVVTKHLQTGIHRGSIGGPLGGHTGAIGGP